MAFTPKINDPGVGESLQCMALAGRQEIGKKFEPSDLQKIMAREHEKQNAIESHILIDNEYYTILESWVKDPADLKYLTEWINSAVWISKSLISSSYFSGKYIFARVNQFPESGKEFKDIFDVLKKEIKDAIKANPSFARSYAGRIYNKIEIKPDKWNPADIVAVRKSSMNKWKGILSESGFLNSRKTMIKTMKQDLSAFAKTLGKKGSKKLKIVEAMEDLYEYNKLINQGIESKEFIPISLKKSGSPDPNVQHIYVKEPKDLSKYFEMTVDITGVKYDADNQKAIISFMISNLAGSADTKYTIEPRGFESTAQFADIQIQLQQPGSSANHGKITLPVTTQQIKLSGGNRAFLSMNSKKKELFNKFTPSMKKKALKSSIHGFTDYRLFEQLSKNNKHFNADISDIKLWAEYVEWLSGGETTQQQFMHNATGTKFYDKLPPKHKQSLNISHTQAKYMKNKVQSYEVAWVIDPKASNLSSDMKDNILKSMWMYAASKGFAIFKNPTSTFYLLSGPYLKCAA